MRKINWLAGFGIIALIIGAIVSVAQGAPEPPGLKARPPNFTLAPEPARILELYALTEKQRVQAAIDCTRQNQSIGSCSIISFVCSVPVPKGAANQRLIYTGRFASDSFSLTEESDLMFVVFADAGPEGRVGAMEIIPKITLKQSKEMAALASMAFQRQMDIDKAYGAGGAQAQYVLAVDRFIDCSKTMMNGSPRAR